MVTRIYTNYSASVSHKLREVGSPPFCTKPFKCTESADTALQHGAHKIRMVTGGRKNFWDTQNRDPLSTKHIHTYTVDN